MRSFHRNFVFAALALVSAAAGAGTYPFGDIEGDAQLNYGRGRPMDVQHIKLEAVIDVQESRIDGVVSITLSPIGDPLREIVLDSVNLGIEKVLDGSGNEMEFEVTSEQLKIYPAEPAPPGKALTVAIHYAASEPEKGMHFRNAANGYSKEETQAWTQGEAEDTRYWMPCYDYPNERATSEIIATVDAAYNALSNGHLVDVKDGASTKTYHWLQDKPHASYLITLVVGPYVEVKDKAGETPLAYYVLPGQEEQARLTFSKTPDMMKFFEEVTDMPYPWDKYGQVPVIDFIAGGMENTSLTSLTERCLQTPASLLTGDSDGLISHELAHQWFGDLLTCRDWSHLWLNEGFATYFQALYFEHDRGADAFADEMIGNANGFMRADQGGSRMPMVRRTYASPDDLFDRRAYEKGSWILHMLRRELGDELFFKGIQEYVKQYRDSVVETNDFMRVMETVSGRGLERFFDQWACHAGFPEIKVTYNWDQPSKTAKVTVQQTQKVDELTPLFHLETQLRFALPEGEHVEDIVLTEAEHTFKIPLDARPIYVRFDPSDSILKKLEFKKPEPMLLAQLEQDPTLTGRLQALEQLGQLKSDKAIEAVIRTLNEGAYHGERTQAAQTLSKMDDKRVLPALLRARVQDDARVRRAVCQALGKQSDAQAEDALIEAVMKDPSPHVAATAIAGLASLRCARALPRVAACLDRDSDDEVLRRAALDAIAAMGATDQLVNIIPFTTRVQPRLSRGSAIAAVGKLGRLLDDPAPARNALEALLKDARPATRTAALNALGTLGDEKAIPAIEAFANISKTESETERANRTIENIRAGQAQSTELRALRTRLNELEKKEKEFNKQLKEIQDRLDGKADNGSADE